MNVFSKRLLVTTFIFLSLFAYTNVHAAQIFFGTERKEIPVYQVFEVGVFVNTQNENANAFEGSISFPEDMLTLREVRDGNSIISLWVKKPSFENESKNTIFYSGVVPGGFNGRRGYLFSLIFESNTTGTIHINSLNEQILRNDGKGSAVVIEKAPLVFSSIMTSSTEGTFFAPHDVTPPESFTGMITSDPLIFDGKNFLVFNTEDKSSGMWGYEIAEFRHHVWQGSIDQKKLAWISAESPYLLKDQERKSFVYIKAIDYAGNERIIMISPSNVVWYEKYFIWCILSLLLCVALIAVFVYGRKKKI